MRQIIVGYDGSAGAATALTWAAAEARLRDLAVLVVAVQNPDPSGPPGLGDGPELGAQAEQAAVETLDGLPHEVSLQQGGPAECLVAACTPEDLLVVGSRGRNPLVGTLLGSVSRACIHASPCPVVVAREPLTLGGPVVVGVDNSEPGRRALQVAADEARLRGVALRAVHAVSWQPTGGELDAPSSDDLVAWGRHLLEGVLTSVKVKAEPAVLPGHTPEVLVRESENAALLVVGSRGRNPIVALLLGSTSDHCVTHATCPTLVVR